MKNLIAKPVLSVPSPVRSPGILIGKKFASQPDKPFQNNDNNYNLMPNQTLLLKVRVTCSNDKQLFDLCNISTLTEVQNSIVNSVKEHLGHDIQARVTFHKGSLIILIAITSASLILISSNQLSFIANDVRNIMSRTFTGVKNLASSISFKKIEKVLGVIRDILSIGAKLFQIFGGGFPPLPPDIGPNGWEPI